MGRQDIRYADVLPMQGNENLMYMRVTAYLCSHRTPYALDEAAKRWVDTLRPDEDCVMCGCLANGERYMVNLLVQRHIPLILVMAGYMPQSYSELKDMVPGVDFAPAIKEEKLLVMAVYHNEEDRCPTADAARARNAMMMRRADHVVVGYAAAYGKVYTQLLTYDRERVTYLLETEPLPRSVDNVENAGWELYHHLRMNILRMSPQDVRKLLEMYFDLGTRRQSELHNHVLALVLRCYKHTGIRSFRAFFKCWGGYEAMKDDKELRKGVQHMMWRSLARQPFSIFFAKW